MAEKKKVVKGMLSEGSKVLSKKKVPAQPKPQPMRPPAPVSNASGGGSKPPAGRVVGGGGQKRLPPPRMPVLSRGRSQRVEKDITPKKPALPAPEKSMPMPKKEGIGRKVLKGVMRGGPVAIAATALSYHKEIGDAVGGYLAGKVKPKAELSEGAKRRVAAGELSGKPKEAAPSPAASAKNSVSPKGSFAQAYRAARKSGAGTRFTWKGKEYAAVSREDVSSGKFKKTRKGYVKNG